MKFLALFLLFGFNSLISQQYERLAIQPIEELHQIGNFKYILYYELDDLCYYVGVDMTDYETQKSGLKLRVYDSEMNLKFESPGQLDSYTYKPTFFRNNTLNPHTIMLVHISNEGSWGQDVYIIRNSQFEHLGLINVATWAEEPEMYWDIAPFISIKKDKDTIVFRFEPTKIIFDPSGLNEKVLKGSEFRYEYRERETYRCK